VTGVAVADIHNTLKGGLWFYLPLNSEGYIRNARLAGSPGPGAGAAGHGFHCNCPRTTDALMLKAANALPTIEVFSAKPISGWLFFSGL
jgi:hypothetical protein